MGIWDRLLKRGQSRPEWAGFMTPSGFDRFVRLVDAECRTCGRPYTLDGNRGLVLMDFAGNGEPSPCGLQNVAQLCGLNAANRWPEIIHDHFANLARIVAGAELTETLQADFEKARPLLKVRLYPHDYPADKYVHYRPAEDIVACLVYDLPDSVVAMTPDAVAAWNVPREDLFKIALENVRAENEFQSETHELPDACQIHSLTGDSFFVASRALAMEDFLPIPLSEYGALVAIPHRHMVIYHPIKDSTCIAALNTMIPMAKSIYEEGPGSVSPNVYWWREAAWWHEGQFTRFPVTFAGRKINLNVPPEFAAKVLSHLT